MFTTQIAARDLTPGMTIMLSFGEEPEAVRIDKVLGMLPSALNDGPCECKQCPQVAVGFWEDNGDGESGPMPQIEWAYPLHPSELVTIRKEQA